MARTIALLALLFAIVAVQARVEVQVMDPAVPNQYIVVYQESTTQEQRDAQMEQFVRNFKMDSFDNKILHKYLIGDFAGFAAKLSQRMLSILQESPIVSYIEQDAVMTASQACKQQTNAVWGIDRIAEKQLNLDGNYNYPSTAGQGVTAYVIDTGININHVEFQGRAIWGANFVDSQNTDCNGHGTHVAGTIGGATYGVAKKVTLVAVKVLNCQGSGSNAGVIAGINYVATNAPKPSVANMSLGGSKSTALDSAVTNAIKAGVTFVVAGGNENDNSCLYSPADVPTAITVGATGVDDSQGNEIDNRAYFSNYGTCVTLFAPGLMIQSAWIGSKNTEVQTISGTSMASPHVAGVCALYLGTHTTATPATVKSWLISNSSPNLLSLDCAGATSQSSCSQSPNKLAYSPCA